RVQRDATPQQVQDFERAEFTMNAGAAALDDFISEGIVGGKIKLLRTVVAEIAFCHRPGLQAVGSDDSSRASGLDHEVIADRIELVAIESIKVGSVEPF